MQVGKCTNQTELCTGKNIPWASTNSILYQPVLGLTWGVLLHGMVIINDATKVEKYPEEYEVPAFPLCISL